MKSIYIVCLVLAICGTGYVYAQSCHLRELDLCAATLVVFVQNPNGLAQTEKDVDKMCTHIQEAQSCLKNYTKRCTTKLQQELINFVSVGGQTLYDDFCTQGTPLRTNYLKNAKCLNDAQKDQRKCMKELQSKIDVLTSVDWDKRIPVLCCLLRRLDGCIRTSTGAKCGQEAVDFGDQLMARIAGRIPNIVCSKFPPDGKDCKALLDTPLPKKQGKQPSSILQRLLSAYAGL